MELVLEPKAFPPARVYQKALFEDHFCPNGIRVRDGKEAAQNLRRAAR